MKKDKWPKHKQGKYCGYELFEDGSIQIARMYADKMTKILSAELALDILLRAVTKQCHELLIPLSIDKKDFWESVKEDYGLDFEIYEYSYTTTNHTITKVKKPTKVNTPKK